MKTNDYNDDGLEQLIKALDPMKQPTGRLGVLGGKDMRKNMGSNAEIGAKHELGIDGMPMRSWLRVPIIDHMQEYLEKAGAFRKNSATVKEVIKKGSLMPWFQKAMIVAESIIADGFATGGFGKWAAWRTPGYSNNANMILVDTQQLRNSVTSEINGG